MTPITLHDGHNSSQRSNSVDIAKGILIILVVTGHVLNGSPTDASTRGYIYFFHMPLFIFLSGYLSSGSVHRDSPTTSAGKQFSRMGRPYLLALAFYTTISIVRSSESFSVGIAVDAALYPFYHLWYIPAIVIYFFATQALIRLGIGIAPVIAISAALSVLLGEFSDRDSGSHFLYYLGDKRYYYYWFFFALGVALRTATLSARWIAPCTLIAAGGAALVLNGIETKPIYIWTLFLIINLIAALSLVATLQSFPSTSVPALQAAGQASLPIYLWHILPIFIAKSVFSGQAQILAATVGAFIVGVCSIALQYSKLPLKRWACGET